MSVLKKVLIALAVIIGLIVLFVGFVCLCKWQNWLPDFTGKVVEFFNKIGLGFISKIKSK